MRRGIFPARGICCVIASRKSLTNASRLSCKARRASAGVDCARSSAVRRGSAPPILANIRRTLCMWATIAAIDRPLPSGGFMCHIRGGRTSAKYSLTRQQCSNDSSSSRSRSRGWATGISLSLSREPVRRLSAGRSVNKSAINSRCRNPL